MAPFPHAAIQPLYQAAPDHPERQYLDLLAELLDQTGRLATSLTKDYTPLPGRNFEASVRVSF